MHAKRSAERVGREANFEDEIRTALALIEAMTSSATQPKRATFTGRR